MFNPIFWIGVVFGAFGMAFVLGAIIAIRDWQDCPIVDDSGEGMG